MPLRSLILPALLIATALPGVAQTESPAQGAAPEPIWVDSYADIPEPRPMACIGNSSAIYCHTSDGRTYAFRTRLNPTGSGPDSTITVQPRQWPTPSAGGAGIARD
ncbi:hypothetical protein HKCCE4037_05680 [Rhodobacterales bacterium HKCCE4037]|nr:hypothetical protein [Rhodobacterales bacterium HKCCE4037]